MISKNSRYTNVLTTEEVYKGKTVFSLNIRELPRFTFKDAVKHLVAEGERLDIIARKYYSDPTLWWVILDANPAYMGEWDISAGDMLVIPTYEDIRAVIQK